jgi:hypothetical protein
MNTIYAVCIFPDMPIESIPFYGGLPRVGETVEGFVGGGVWLVTAVRWTFGTPTLQLEPVKKTEETPDA